MLSDASARRKHLANTAGERADELKFRPMDPAVLREFAEESVREVNRLRGFGAAGPTGYAVMTEA